MITREDLLPDRVEERFESGQYTTDGMTMGASVLYSNGGIGNGGNSGNGGNGGGSGNGGGGGGSSYGNGNGGSAGSSSYGNGIGVGAAPPVISVGGGVGGSGGSGASFKQWATETGNGRRREVGGRRASEGEASGKSMLPSPTALQIA